MQKIRSKWITMVFAVVIMVGAMKFFTSEPDRFVPKPIATIQIDTIGIKRQELGKLLNLFFGTKTSLTATIDSSLSDSYRVFIESIGEPESFLNKNYSNLLTATRKANGFEVHKSGSIPTFQVELIMNADQDYVVVPVGVLARLMD